MSRTRDGSGDRVIAMIQDVSQRKQLEAELMHLGRYLFDAVDFARGKGVAGGFVPIGAAHGVEEESRFFAALLPVAARRALFTPHLQLPEDEDARLDEPKPPRETPEEPPPLKPRTLARMAEGEEATEPFGRAVASIALGLGEMRLRPNRFQPLEA